MANLLKRIFKKCKQALAIEDVIREKLPGDMQKNALDLIAFMKANGISPSTTPRIDDTPEGKAYTYGSDSANGGCGLILIEPGKPGWGYCYGGFYDSALLRNEYQDFPVDENVKAFAWAHVSACRNFTTNGKECGCGYQPGRRITIFGKEFHHTCHGVMGFDNPDGEMLKLVKKLIDVRLQINADAAKKDKT